MSFYESRPGLFGETNYYDEAGNHVGSSWEGIVPGTVNHYDSGGRHVASSVLGITTVYNHYVDGELFGDTRPGLFGEEIHSAGGTDIGTTWDINGCGLIDLDF